MSLAYRADQRLRGVEGFLPLFQSGEALCYLRVLFTKLLGLGLDIRKFVGVNRGSKYQDCRC
jgi:hypothetical protein